MKVATWKPQFFMNPACNRITSELCNWRLWCLFTDYSSMLISLSLIDVVDCLSIRISLALPILSGAHATLTTHMVPFTPRRHSMSQFVRFHRRV